MGPDGIGESEQLVGQPKPKIETEQRQPSELIFNVEGKSVASSEHPTRNEDSFFWLPNGAAGVFDGVGGESGGDIAAKIARDEVDKYTREVKQKNPNGLTREQARSAGYKAMIRANIKILEAQGRQIEGKRYEKMSTTGCIVVPYKETKDGKTINGFIVVHVGDSRVYLLRNGQLRQITLDDSLPRLKESEEKARKIQLELSNVDAENYSNLPSDLRFYFDNSNLITQALGDPNISPRITDVEGLKPGDIVLVCTDGIHDNLTDKEIESILASATKPELVATELINKAQNRANSSHPRAKPDDMTAVVMMVGSGEPSSSSPIKPSPVPPSQELPSGPQLGENIAPQEGLKVPGKINIGDTVWVRRTQRGNETEGRVDYNWKVEKIYLDNGEVYVTVKKKLPDGTLLEKDVRYPELEELNSPTSIGGITMATTPPDLIRRLSLLDTDNLPDNLPDEVKRYLKGLSPEELGDIISKIINGELPLDNSLLSLIPGLREKILEFKIKAEKNKNGEHSPIQEQRPGSVSVIRSKENIQVGSKVAVIRSTGMVDIGWKVIKIDPVTGIVTVEKEEGGKRLSKDVLIELLYEWNRPTRENDINNASNLSQLVWILTRLEEGGLYGLDGTFYPSDHLNKIIELVFSGEAPLTAVTRTGGLREKIMSWLNEEILNNNVPSETLKRIYRNNPGLEEEIKKKRLEEEAKKKRLEEEAKKKRRGRRGIFGI